jgi:hypothetical protein
VALPPMDWPAVMQSAIEDQVDHRSHCHNLPGDCRAITRYLQCLSGREPSALQHAVLL